MRLDKFLFFIRLTKTRSLAQAIIAAGHTRVNGAPVQRGHHSLQCGDVITLPLNGHIRIIRVIALPPRRGPASEAQSCYLDLVQQTPVDAGEG